MGWIEACRAIKLCTEENKIGEEYGTRMAIKHTTLHSDIKSEVNKSFDKHKASERLDERKERIRRGRFLENMTVEMTNKEKKTSLTYVRRTYVRQDGSLLLSDIFTQWLHKAT